MPVHCCDGQMCGCYGYPLDFKFECAACSLSMSEELQKSIELAFIVSGKIVVFPRCLGAETVEVCQ